MVGRIEVVGRLAASGLPALVDYCVAMPLDTFHGRRGIEIVGASRTERRFLNGPADADAGEWSAAGRR